MDYEAVIGLEVHCELKTNSKMFSGAPVSFGERSNTQTNVIDWGFPGVMPALNEKGVEYAIRVCHALHMTIDHVLLFDRKNYYYADLPKGFQITQDRRPIGRDGYLDITVDGEVKRIAIERLHMEEDTAKQEHYSDFTLLDYNRAGIPLIEIVTRPVIRSGQEAAAYLEKLRSIFLYTEVSDARLEEGSMRCDVNISIRPKGQKEFGTKTEIKNLNSISNVQRALDYEFARQKEIVTSGGVVLQETLRFNEAEKKTVKMRDKGDAVDYKYYTEPNILPVVLDEEWIAKIKENLPEMAEERAARYQKDYGLNEAEASQLVATKTLSDYFEKVITHTKQYKAVTHWLLGDVQAYLAKTHTAIENLALPPEDLAGLVELVAAGDISGKQAKEVFEQMMTSGEKPADVVARLGMKQISDSDVIAKVIADILDAQPNLVTDYAKGKTRAVGYIVGQIMKATKGQANPKIANEMVTATLKKRAGL